MLANKIPYIFPLILLLNACAVPAISKDGAKVKMVKASSCKFVGNITSMFRDSKKGNLNYEGSRKQYMEYQSNLVRERAAELGANQVVSVYTTRDPHIENQISFYSAHKCSK